MIITDSKNQDNERTARGLENEVPQSSGLNQKRGDDEKKKDVKEEAAGEPVDNGGVKSIEYDQKFEKQWLAVRDEYLSNYPDLEDTDTEYEKGGFYKMIEGLAKKRKQTPKEVQHEIMRWSLIK